MLRNLREIHRFRELLWFLAMREIKVRYKQTVVGVAWVIFQPIALMLVTTIVFSLILKVKTDIPYPVFVYAGLLPWTFFSTVLANGSMSLAGEAGLITKVYFPREILPLSSMLSAAVDMAVRMAVYAVLLAVYRIGVGVEILLFFPLLFVQVLFTMGLVFIMSALNVFYRDLRFIIPMALSLWVFLTPVYYPLEQVGGRLRFWFQLNPMTPLMEGFRYALVGGAAPDWRAVAALAAFSAALFAAGWSLFRSTEKWFADVI